MTFIYFIADRSCKRAAALFADVFMPTDGICYDVIRRAAGSGRTAIALANPDTFLTVDNYLCAENLYGRNVDTFETRDDFFNFYKDAAPEVVITDDAGFARQLKSLEVALQ